MSKTGNFLDKTEICPKNGLTLYIDKPLEWTSFNVVKKVKYRVKAKVGHAGTLDPKATGVLIVCVGKHTKIIEQFMGHEKEYIAKVKLGATTPSFDTETEEENICSADHITQEQIENVLEDFRGEIDQFPPIFSALKQNGQAIYKKARNGEEVIVQSRKVTILENTILSYSDNILEIKVRCSKGTYIRSLANDIGKSLGVGGYLIGLQRTAIGDVRIENCISVDEFCAHFDALAEAGKVLTPEQLADM